MARQVYETKTAATPAAVAAKEEEKQTNNISLVFSVSSLSYLLLLHYNYFILHVILSPLLSYQRHHSSSSFPSFSPPSFLLFASGAFLLLRFPRKHVLIVMVFIWIYLSVGRYKSRLTLPGVIPVHYLVVQVTQCLCG